MDVNNTIRWKNKDAIKTLFDGYEDELQTIINQSKFIKRAEDKPMAKVKDDDEAHNISRAGHMKQAADIGKRLAKELGLNETVIYIGMLMHDAGHPFGSHEGEETLKEIGEYLNVGYYNHNAEGVEVVQSEDICGKSINLICLREKDKDSKENREKFKNDFWYFLDVIVGHNGEETISDMKEAAEKKDKNYNGKNLKERVLYKVSKSNRENISKCPVETLEAQLSKPADVIAYLKSDMLDAVECEKIKKFSDGYLEKIGELLFETTGKLTKEEKISKVKEMIREIKIEKLRETESDVLNEKNKEILETAEMIIEKIEEENIDSYYPGTNDYEKINIIVSKIVNDYMQKLKGAEENKETIEAKAHKIIDFTHKLLKVRYSVIEETMTRVQEALQEDYVENTLKKWKEIDENKNIKEEDKIEKKKKAMNFSERVIDIVYRKNGIKDLDYNEYVVFTKKKYQTGCLPPAVLRTVKLMATALVKIGVIRDKFYDEAVLSEVKDENVKSKMKVKYRKEKGYDKYKNAIGINEFKVIKKPKVLTAAKKYTGKIPTRINNRKKYFKSVYGYTQRQGERFARICEDVYYAIHTTVRNNVMNAIAENYKPKEYLRKEKLKKLQEIRQEIQDRFDGIPSQGDLEEYISEITEREIDRLEYHVAERISIEYIGGKTDRGIKDMVKSMGCVSKILLGLEDKESKKPNENVLNLSKKLEYNEDTAKLENNQEEDKER